MTYMHFYCLLLTIPFSKLGIHGISNRSVVTTGSGNKHNIKLTGTDNPVSQRPDTHDGGHATSSTSISMQK